MTIDYVCLLTLIQYRVAINLTFSIFIKKKSKIKNVLCNLNNLCLYIICNI